MILLEIGIYTLENYIYLHRIQCDLFLLLMIAIILCCNMLFGISLLQPDCFTFDLNMKESEEKKNYYPRMSRKCVFLVEHSNCLSLFFFSSTFIHSNLIFYFVQLERRIDNDDDWPAIAQRIWFAFWTKNLFLDSTVSINICVDLILVFIYCYILSFYMPVVINVTTH